MSRVANMSYVNGQFELPMVSLVQRINRCLEHLSPYRELYYKHSEVNYYMRVLAPGHPEHMKEFGPIYGKYLVALAEHVNLWTIKERMMIPKVVKHRNGTIFEQARLPVEWQFEVVTDVLADAVRMLRDNGYVVTPPYAVDQVTAEVTEPEPHMNLGIVEAAAGTGVPQPNPHDHAPDCEHWTSPGSCSCDAVPWEYDPETGQAI